MGSIRTKIDDDSGLTMPAEYCEALGLALGAEVILTLENDHIRLSTVDAAIVDTAIDAAIRHAQDVVNRYVDPQRSLVDELLADRRAEAERE